MSFFRVTKKDFAIFEKFEVTLRILISSPKQYFCLKMFFTRIIKCSETKTLSYRKTFVLEAQRQIKTAL